MLLEGDFKRVVDDTAAAQAGLLPHEALIEVAPVVLVGDAEVKVPVALLRTLADEVLKQQRQRLALSFGQFVRNRRSHAPWYRAQT